MTDASRVKGATLFFLSRTYMGEHVILEPRVPDNWLVENGWEDGTTKRICTAPSVGQCLMALSCDLAGAVLFAYRTDDDGHVGVTEDAVPDCALTGERWFLSPTEFSFRGKLRVSRAADASHAYRYGDGRVAELFEWEWSWIPGKEKAPEGFSKGREPEGPCS